MSTTAESPGLGAARLRLLLLPMLVLLALLSLSACSATGSGDNAPAADASAGAAGSDGGGEALEAPAGDGADDAGQDAADLAGEGTVAGDSEEPMMVRSVRMEVLVDDVAAAVSKARAAATSAKGWVSTEEVNPGQDDRAGWATMVLRVPSSDLDAVVTGLEELGEVTSSSSQAEDVTTEYRDVEARVKTLEASAERLRDLVAEAPSVESIASLERELADREAELDALKARMKVLSEDVSRSTITLHLAEDGAALDDARTRTGFVSGLAAGWKAFLGSVTVLLTALGALLPFLVVLALIGVPLLLWRRRQLASRRDRHPAPAGDPDGS